MIQFKFEKVANVTTAGGPMDAPGSMNMPGNGYQSVSAGAANVPGMSIHCLGCGTKLKRGEKKCHKCGNDTRRVAEKKASAFDTGGDKIDGQGSQGFSTSEDEGYGGQAVQAGAAKVPGLSTHCLKCGCKLTGKLDRCPECGNDVKRVAQAPASGSTPPGESVGNRNDERGDTAAETGGEAAVDQDRTRGAYVGLGKYANASIPKSVLGGAVAVGSGILGLNVYNMTKNVAKQGRDAEIAQLVSEGKIDPSHMPESFQKLQHFQELEKFARSGANPILGLRMALKRARQASGKFRSDMVRRPK